MSMPALASLLEEHQQSISRTVSSDIKAVLASLKAKLDTDKLH